MSENKIKVLFVCMGNICRSPAAENMMRSMVREKGLGERFEIDSAGTLNRHAGNPPDTRMVEAAENRGIKMTGRARQVTPGDFESFHWILAMDEDNYRDLLDVRSMCNNPTAKLVKFCEYCENFDVEDVPDPYYGGRAGFEIVLDILEDGCAALLKKLNR